MESLSILLVDDHEMILKGAAAALVEELEGANVLTAKSAAEVLDRAAQTSFQVIIVDLSLPGRGGLDLIRELRRITPKSAILVHTMHSEEQFGLASLRAGANGFVCKADSSQTLAKAVRTVISGRLFVSEVLLNRLAYLTVDPNSTVPHEQLSDRELQVYRMIVQGRQGKEIAGELSLSPKTVSTYRSRLLEKMQMQNDSELIRYALEHRLFMTE